MGARRPGPTRRTVILLVLIFVAGVAAVVGVKVLRPRGDPAAVTQARARATESVAHYEHQFTSTPGPRPAAGAGPVEVPEGTRPSGSISAPERFQKLTPVIHVLRIQPDYLAAEAIMKERAPREWTGEDLQVLSDVLTRQSALLDAIRTIANEREPVYKADLSAGYATELYHLRQLRQMAALLNMNAAVQARQGDTEEAINDYLAIISLGETLLDEPILLSQLVRISMLGMAYEGIGTVLQPGKLSPEQARRIVRETAGAYHREAYANALAGETAFGLDAIDDAAGNRDLPFALGGFDSPAGDVLAGYLVQTPVGSAFLNSDRQQYAKFMNRIVRAAEQPYYEVQSELETIETEIDDLSFLSLYTRNLVPGLVRAQEAQARAEAMIHLMRIGLSLELYYGGNGVYPDTLDALAAELGGEVPVDPFTGQPYVYVAEENAFLLYSLGRNQQDDGGRHHVHEGDIVWRGIEP